MGRRTETSMASSGRQQRLAALVADRVIDAVLALASLSISLGTTAGRGRGAHNICAGHGSCARLLGPGGPKLGQGRRPNLGIGAQDERFATELYRAQSAGTYLLICLFAAETIGITKFLDGESTGQVRRCRSDSCRHTVSSFRGRRSDGGGFCLVRFAGEENGGVISSPVPGRNS